MSAAQRSEHYEDRELVVTRVLDAPVELVWKAWVEPDRIARWWGPNGFTTTTHEMDVRPGGVWRFDMHGPDGRDYPNRVVFEEVVENERIAYTHTGDGDVDPVCFGAVFTFERRDEGTKVTLRMTFPSREERDRVCREHGALEGAIQTIGRLADLLFESVGGKRETLTIALPSEREIILRRAFDAPRELVFEAISRPEHVRRWWGCGMLETTACEMDFRPGGAWRVVQRTPDGQEHPFRGEYKEIVAPERIVQSFIYDVEGIREHPSLETMTLTEEGGRTVLTTVVLHASRQACEGQLQAGMEGGASESFNRLDRLLGELSGAGAAS